MKIYKAKKILILIIPTIILFFNVMIIANPHEIINSAKFGINLWFNNIIPSLLPFIIFTNILIELGAVNFLGMLLEPIMEPIFNVPGVGGFALITSMTSGYPLGAKIVSDLRIRKEIDKYEAQRLISFCNNSGPLFILGVVGIGIFKNAKVGYFIMVIHYLGAIITGFIFKNYKYKNKNKNIKIYNFNKNIFLKAFSSMKIAKIKNNKNFGQILGDSISCGMETILNIGGFIIIFCVLIKIIDILNIIEFLKENIFYCLLKNFNISSNCFSGFLMGIIEMTNGAKIIGLDKFSEIQILAISFIISFGGLSVLAQSVSFLSKTDINILVYIISKLLHSIITVVLGFLLYPFFNFKDSFISASTTNNFYNFNSFSLIFNIFFIIIFFLVVFSFIINLYYKFIIFFKKNNLYFKYKNK